MKKLIFAALPLFASLSMPAQAPYPIQNDSIKTPWRNVCSVAGNRPLHIKTPTGDVEGYCVSIDVDSITVRGKDNKIVTIGRTAYSKIMLVTGEPHPLRALGRGMRSSFRSGFRALFSPAAPIGLIQVPATVAWGAVSAPFCVLGELKSGHAEEREISVM